MFSLFRKKEKKRQQKPESRTQRKKGNADLKEIKNLILNLSTKDDIKQLTLDVASSRKAVIQEVKRLPDQQQLSSILAEQITAPLKTYIEKEMTTDQAVKQLDGKQLSAYQADSGLETIVGEMKQKMDMLTARHLKVLSVLAQQRNDWLRYEEIGALCSPPVSGSCARGYVADLINVYKIEVEKKSLGRQSGVKLSPQAIKQLALSKLID
jgi:hypothetical protein